MKTLHHAALSTAQLQFDPDSLAGTKHHRDNGIQCLVYSSMLDGGMQFGLLANIYHSKDYNR